MFVSVQPCMGVRRDLPGTGDGGEKSACDRSESTENGV